MSIWKRIKNLWRISEYEVPKIGEKSSDLPIGSEVITQLWKKKQMAKIIHLTDPLDKLLEK